MPLAHAPHFTGARWNGAAVARIHEAELLADPDRADNARSDRHTRSRSVVYQNGGRLDRKKRA